MPTEEKEGGWEGGREGKEGKRRRRRKRKRQWKEKEEKRGEGRKEEGREKGRRWGKGKARRRRDESVPVLSECPLFLYTSVWSYCGFLMLCKIYTQGEVEVPVTSWVPKREGKRGEEWGRKEEGRGRKEEREEEGKRERGRKGGKAHKQPCL